MNDYESLRSTPTEELLSEIERLSGFPDNRFAQIIINLYNWELRARDGLQDERWIALTTNEKKETT